MRNRLLTSVLAVLVSVNVSATVIAQDKEFDEVRSVVKDFNQILFEQANVQRALQAHFYLSESDATDKQAGFSTEFSRVTKNIAPDRKMRYFSTGFYLECGVPNLTWALGKMRIAADTQLVDNEILEIDNGKLKKLWDNERKLFGKHPDVNLSPRTLAKYEEFVVKLAAVIDKHIDHGLMQQNLRGINERMTIRTKTIGARRYYTLENQLFVYKVAIKAGRPKIMSISQNP